MATGSARRCSLLILVALVAGCTTENGGSDEEWEPSPTSKVPENRVQSGLYSNSTTFEFDAPESAVEVSMRPRDMESYWVDFAYVEVKSSAWLVILDKANSTIHQDGPFSNGGHTEPMEVSGNVSFRLWAVSDTLVVFAGGPDPEVEDLPVHYRNQTLKFDLIEPTSFMAEEADVGLRILDAPPGLWNLVAPNGTVTAMLGPGFDEVAWLGEPGEWSMEPVVPALGDVRIRISSL